MKTTPEIWLPVPGYQGRYFISNLGNVKKVLPNKSETPVKVRLDRAGYLTVRLYHNKRDLTKFVHRLVATAFIQNLQDKPKVNHKDGNKLNNHVDNLEWVTHAENIQHAYDCGLISRDRKVRPVVDRCSGRRFGSIREASDFYMIPYSTCKNYLNGKRPNITCLQYEEKGAA